MKYPEGTDWPRMNGWPVGAYPPPGFLPVPGCDLGNGDYFGLYWPTGRENEYPLVCEMSHDDHSLVPSFSSYEKWREWCKANNWERGEEEIDDEQFVLGFVHEATSCLKKNDVEEAIRHLKKACEAMPDLAEPWHLLASQRRRIADRDGADEATLQGARLGSWVFSGAGFQSLRSVRPDGPFADDPLVQHRESLMGKIGGVKESPRYDSMRRCVDLYADRGEYVAAITLLYNYGYAMERETISFRERAGFDANKWLAEYVALCTEGLGVERPLLRDKQLI